MHFLDFHLTESDKLNLNNAVHCNSPVTGYTHSFYNYPARFSPEFARTIINIFTEPGDLVLDPFMGGATTVVEARLLGRRCIGADINEISAFLAKIKTRVFLKKDLRQVRDWAYSLKDRLNLHNPPIRHIEWIESGYQRNINTRQTWPTRKTIEFILEFIYELPKKVQRMFARCVLMKTSQWALDCTTNIPTAAEFRVRYMQYIDEMIGDAIMFSSAVREADKENSSDHRWRSVCLNRSVIGLEKEPIVKKNPAPKLILTSPPYAGVHVLYHRWQIKGRRETPAPYWIANAQDGNGASFYTFGDRKQKDNNIYFENLLNSYKSIAKIADKDTFLVQMVGFSKPDVQLPRYIETMQEAGFEEAKLQSISNAPDDRLWRSVPNRKWYAANKRSTASSKEVVLFHHLK